MDDKTANPKSKPAAAKPVALIIEKPDSLALDEFPTLRPKELESTGKLPLVGARPAPDGKMPQYNRPGDTVDVKPDKLPPGFEKLAEKLTQNQNKATAADRDHRAKIEEIITPDVAKLLRGITEQGVAPSDPNQSDKPTEVNKPKGKGQDRVWI